MHAAHPVIWECPIDPLTIQIYDTGANDFAALYESLQPEGLYSVVRTTFYQGAPTLDVGCGSGRDLAWLNRNGYPAIGCDASAPMLVEARRRYPDLTVFEDSLPDLQTVASHSVDNVLCSGVMMHLCLEEVEAALRTLARVLHPGGRLVVSVRRGREGAEREPDGRLFTSISPQDLRALLEGAGFRVRLCRDDDDFNRPGIVWSAVGAELAEC